MAYLYIFFKHLSIFGFNNIYIRKIDHEKRNLAKILISNGASFRAVSAELKKEYGEGLSFDVFKEIKTELITSSEGTTKIYFTLTKFWENKIRKFQEIGYFKNLSSGLETMITEYFNNHPELNQLTNLMQFQYKLNELIDTLCVAMY